MNAKWILQSLIWLVLMGALLFVPAGTLHWPAAWVFQGCKLHAGDPHIDSHPD